jgi:DMSO/TMAO reductase YedYZ molybdopterin-dependent catalytic subunit
MLVLKRHKKIVLIAVLLVAVLIVSLVVTQYVSKVSVSHVPSPTPTPSPVPTEISPTPTVITSPTPTQSQAPMPTLTPTPASSPTLQPGEVTQYQGQSLTPISDFTGEFLTTSINGAVSIDPTTYVLSITDLVNQSINYTYDDVVNDFPSVQEVVGIVCVEGWSAIVLWEGVPVMALLQEAGISPGATTLIFYAADGYSTALPLGYIEQNNLILAYKINNVTLNADTGWPFILVAQGQYGYKWIKWLTEIDVSSNSSYLGYYESRGYPNNAAIGPLGPDPKAKPPNSYVSAAEAIGVGLAAIIIAAAVYIIFVKKHASRGTPQLFQSSKTEAYTVKQNLKGNY